MESKFTSPCEGCPYHKVSCHTHTCRRRVVGFYFQPELCRARQRLQPRQLAAEKELAELLKGR